MARIDLSGKVFHRLTVVSYSHTDKHNQAWWNCVCECGAQCVIRGQSIRESITKSCGCYRKELAKNPKLVKHGDYLTKEYRCWHSMKVRCSPSAKPRDRIAYYERGIRVCSEWESSYPKFLEDMGRCPNGYSLDRVDNNGPYSKQNCRWATRTEQQRNNRGNRIITIDGETMTLVEWSERLDIPWATLHSRVKRGWPSNRLSEPVKKKTDPGDFFFLQSAITITCQFSTRVD